MSLANAHSEVLESAPRERPGRTWLLLLGTLVALPGAPLLWVGGAGMLIAVVVSVVWLLRAA